MICFTNFLFSSADGTELITLIKHCLFVLCWEGTEDELGCACLGDGVFATPKIGCAVNRNGQTDVKV